MTVTGQKQGKMDNGLKVSIYIASNGRKVTPLLYKSNLALSDFKYRNILCACAENPDHLPDQKSLTEIFHRVWHTHDDNLSYLFRFINHRP